MGVRDWISGGLKHVADALATGGRGPSARGPRPASPDAEALAANHFRAALESKILAAMSAPHRAAEVNRLNEGFQPTLYAHDAAARWNWPLMVARLRWLIDNDPDVSSLARVFVDHVVGAGINVWATTLLGEGDQGLELNTEFNREVNEDYRIWCDEEFDVEGLRTFGEVQRQGIRELMAPGEFFLVEHWLPDRGRVSPLAYKAIEAEQLDESVDNGGSLGPDGRRRYRGIEYDANWRPLFYHFLGEHPYGEAATGTSTPVPAARVIHYWDAGRPSARRGFPWLAACVAPAHDRDWLVGNVLTAAAVQAIFTVIAKGGPAGNDFGLLDFETPNSDSLPKLGRGVIVEGNSDTEYQAFQPSQPSGGFGEFLGAIQGQEAQAGGLSKLRMTRDYSQVNYSSARGAGEDDAMVFRPLAENFGRRVVLGVRNRWLDVQVGSGRVRSVSPTLYFAQPRRWRKARLQFPSRRYLDPQKESAGARTRMEDGTTTLQMECDHLHGIPVEEVIAQRAYETALAKRHGVRIASMGPASQGPADASGKTDAATETADEGAD